MKKLITLTFLTLLCHFVATAQCTIMGSLTTCVGSSTYLYMDSTSLSCMGGTWTSGNPSVATASTSGTITGVAAGTATITYVSTGGTATAVVTVNPGAAAIGGTTTLCPGTSTTLTDATPGGTWSSSSTYYATINAATGVLNAINPGTVTIFYTIPGGCSASVSITISSSLGTDSLWGPTSVCAGSNITISTTATGGTWSSSNTLVATVGASTGVVTGVATGTANISYTITGGACGSSSIYTTVSVNPTVVASPIYGTLTANIGATSTLWDAVSGGYWSSSNPSVATISTSGVVTGVAAGTTTIQYVAYSCTSADTVYATFTVTTFDGISGNVYFVSPYYGNVKVWLITFNTGTLDLEAADSVTLSATGTSVYYQFTGIPTDSFRVKAATMDSASLTYGNVPTYHDSSYHWSTANVIMHTAGTSDINKNIYMHVGTVTSGPGFISGNVMSGADKGTSGSVPVVGMLIFAVDATGVVVQKTYTDASGNYSISNLPVGTTYTIYPEAINYATVAYTSISLTASAPSMTAAKFIEHTISKIITPIWESVNTISNSNSSVTVFPNPSSGNIQLQWFETANEKGTISISDMSGREIYKAIIEMNMGAGVTQVDLSSIPSGLYIISVRSGNINYTNKIEVGK